MTADTFLMFAATYDTLADAEADFDAAREVYIRLGLSGSLDAAVIAKENGKVTIVRKREQSEHTDGWIGAGIGLATGALVALFPAVGIWAGMLTGGIVGGSVGVVTGHIVSGVSRHDLKEIGEHLDDGEFGLILVTTVNVEADIEKALARADKLTRKEMRLDLKELDRELRQLEKDNS